MQLLRGGKFGSRQGWHQSKAIEYDVLRHRRVTHKFLEKLAKDQSSARREKVMRTGIERRLL
jgi:hypothetical protein